MWKDFLSVKLRFEPLSGMLFLPAAPWILNTPSLVMFGEVISLVQLTEVLENMGSLLSFYLGKQERHIKKKKKHMKIRHIYICTRILRTQDGPLEFTHCTATAKHHPLYIGAAFGASVQWKMERGAELLMLTCPRFIWQHHAEKIVWSLAPLERAW